MFLLLLIPIAVTLTGIYLFVRLGARIFNPRRFFNDVRHLLRKQGAAKNLSLALAGTLGVGNIVGVAVGITVGGAGSVFWLMVSAVPAAVIKYAESTLALDCKGAGMASATCSAFPRIGGVLSYVYAASALLLAFTMGAGLQSASFSEAMGTVFNISPVVFAALLALPTLAVMLFGVHRIKDLTSLFVSFASAIYILIALGTVICFRDRLPAAFSMIIEGAFTPSGVSGGFLSVILSGALREGFLRGILSNEAGLGTSAMAHASDSCYTPHEAGLVGVIEVVADTLILCPLTALMLLVAGDPSSGSAVEYVFSSVRHGGVFIEYILAASIFFFAFSTVISWISYGTVSLGFLSSRGKLPFMILFLFSIVIGGVLGSEYLVGTVDLVMFPLAVISLSTVIKCSDRVVTLSERSLGL